jgi:hypothetical protein
LGSSTDTRRTRKYYPALQARTEQATDNELPSLA